MYNFVRKTMMIISVIFIGGIIYFVFDIILKNTKIDDAVRYSFAIIFALCIAVSIFVKSYKMKKIFCDFKLPYHYKIAFILASIFVIFLYLSGIYIFIYEIFYNFETEISSIIEILSVFVFYNLLLDILKKKTEQKTTEEGMEQL